MVSGGADISMTYAELKYATSFTTTALAALAYGWRVSALHAAGYFDGPDGMALTGRALLILVGLVVGAGILGQIALALVTALRGGEVEMDEDERDRLIELRTMNWAFSTFGAGFLAALVALALGHGAFAVFHYIAYAMVLTGLAADLIRITLHRRGV